MKNRLFYTTTCAVAGFLLGACGGSERVTIVVEDAQIDQGGGDGQVQSDVGAGGATGKPDSGVGGGVVDAQVDSEPGADSEPEADSEPDADSDVNFCVSGDTISLGPCEKCGKLVSVCSSSGIWAEPVCMDQKSCNPGEEQTQSCSTGGTQSRSCTPTCEWSQWSPCPDPPECVDGQTLTQPCGNCGMQTRTCKDGKWGAFGPCSGEGPCSPGAVDNQPCGNCGVRARYCTATCVWGSWSGCSGEGVCTPGATQSCMCSSQGGISACCGQQLCTSKCTWGECGLKPGAECNWNGGTTWRCCDVGKSQFCLSSCKWSTDCSYCSGCGC